MKKYQKLHIKKWKKVRAMVALFDRRSLPSHLSELKRMADDRFTCYFCQEAKRRQRNSLDATCLFCPAGAHMCYVNEFYENIRQTYEAYQKFGIEKGLLLDLIEKMIDITCKD